MLNLFQQRFVSSIIWLTKYPNFLLNVSFEYDKRITFSTCLLVTKKSAHVYCIKTILFSYVVVLNSSQTVMLDRTFAKLLTKLDKHPNNIFCIISSFKSNCIHISSSDKLKEGVPFIRGKKREACKVEETDCSDPPMLSIDEFEVKIFLCLKPLFF